MRRELAGRVGPWRSGWTIRLSPSQDWLWRAAKLGAQLRELPRVSVIGFPSGSRPGSYAASGAAEHARWRARLQSDPAWPEAILTRYIRTQADGGRLPPSARPARQVSWALRNAGSAAVASAGLHPLAVWTAIRHPGPGGFLTWLRKRRGLPARGSRMT
jgi:hypothetical protein